MPLLLVYDLFQRLVLLTTRKALKLSSIFRRIGSQGNFNTAYTKLPHSSLLNTRVSLEQFRHFFDSRFDAWLIGNSEIVWNRSQNTQDDITECQPRTVSSTFAHWDSARQCSDIVVVLPIRALYTWLH